MSNVHTPINEEVEVVLKLKVKLTQAHHYDLTESQLKESIEEAKIKLKAEFLNMVEDEFFHQELTESASFDYKVQNIEESN